MQLPLEKIDTNLKSALQKSQWRLVFGGSFDPVHLGHKNLVTQLIDIFSPKKFHLVPCKTPALKDLFLTKDKDRLAMLNLAFKNLQPRVFIDKRELERKRVSYTFDTLQSIRAEIGTKAPLAFIIGSDLLPELHLWHKIESIHLLANFVIIKRPNSYLKIPKGLQNFSRIDFTKPIKANGAYMLLELNQLLNISSSFIRKELAKNHKLKYMLAPDVLKYIEKKGLYKEIYDK